MQNIYLHLLTAFFPTHSSNQQIICFDFIKKKIVKRLKYSTYLGLSYLMVFFIFLLHNFSSGYNCDAQYTKSDGSLTCGFFLNGEFTWHQAIEACQNHGAKLPTIMNDADIENIKRMKDYFKIIIFKKDKGFNLT